MELTADNLGPSNPLASETNWAVIGPVTGARGILSRLIDLKDTGFCRDVEGNKDTVAIKPRIILKFKQRPDMLNSKV